MNFAASKFKLARIGLTSALFLIISASTARESVFPDVWRKVSANQDFKLMSPAGT